MASIWTLQLTFQKLFTVFVLTVRHLRDTFDFSIKVDKLFVNAFVGEEVFCHYVGSESIMVNCDDALVKHQITRHFAIAYCDLVF